MDKPNLALVPLEDLIEELRKRHDSIIVAGYRIGYHTSKDHMTVDTYWKGHGKAVVFLTECLLNDYVEDNPHDDMGLDGEEDIDASPEGN